jgi:hypothetical protein
MLDLANTTPSKLRENAAQARAIAATMEDDERRAEALVLAVEYEVAAEMLERVDRRFHH